MLFVLSESKFQAVATHTHLTPSFVGIGMIGKLPSALHASHGLTTFPPPNRFIPINSSAANTINHIIAIAKRLINTRASGS